MHVRIKKMRCLSMDNIWEFFEDLDEMCTCQMCRPMSLCS